MRNLTFKLISLFLLPFLLSGCFGFGLGGAGGAVSNPNVYAKGGVTKGFPAVPLIPKAQTVESYSNEGVFGASFISPDSIDKVVRFYNDNLTPAGFEAQLKENAQNNYTFNVKNDKYTGTIIINVSADPKKTAITMSLWEKDKAP